MIFSPYSEKKRTFSLPEIAQIEVTEIAIKFFNLDQLTQKMSQIEANTSGYEFRFFFGANN